MEIKFNSVRTVMENDGTWVMLRAQDEAEARAICESVEPGKEYVADIKKYHKKRSLDANNMCWELCTKLSEALSRNGLIVSKEDIYRDHVRTSGRCDYLALIDEAVDGFIKEWSKRGIGWFVDIVDECKIPGCKKLCVYYGSSTYDSAEMSRLLDSLVQDCRDCGVDKFSDLDIEEAKAAWR